MAHPTSVRGPTGPHEGEPVIVAGAPLDSASGVLILTHGRGGTAESIVSSLAPLLAPDSMAVLAPQAAGNSWYPFSFMSPIPQNEPGISSGLAVLGGLVARAGAAGIPPERVAILGFSQGACLTMEFAARNARAYGAIVGYSGGLIGPDGTPRDYAGSLDGTPVFVGCSDVDAHIPVDRVREAAATLRRLGGDVDERIYPGMGHTINPEELAVVRAMLLALAQR